MNPRYLLLAVLALVVTSCHEDMESENDMPLHQVSIDEIAKIDSITQITPSSAVVWGTLDQSALMNQTDYYLGVTYAVRDSDCTDSGYAPVEITSDTHFTATLKYLCPGRTYHCSLSAMFDGATESGHSSSFVTGGVDDLGIADRITMIGIFAATVQGEINMAALDSIPDHRIGVVYSVDSLFAARQTLWISENGDGSIEENINNLIPGTIYYYRLFVYTKGFYHYGSTHVFSTREDIRPEPVDLGLSVRWASWNVGATKPEEMGSLFFWGEVMEKDYYEWDNYLYFNEEQDDVSSELYSAVYEGHGSISGSKYDAARSILGGDWRMPTVEECRELIASCSYTHAVQNGVAGFRFMGKTGNTIFLPAREHHSPVYDRYYSEYWTEDYMSSTYVGSAMFRGFGLLHYKYRDVDREMTHASTGSAYECYYACPIRAVTK